MLKILNVCISLFVSILVTNVWLFRFNKETPYRGGEAKNMIEEFAAYGLDLNTMYLIGSLKIIASLGLIIDFLNQDFCLLVASNGNFDDWCYLFSFKISDPAIKYFPQF